MELVFLCGYSAVCTVAMGGVHVSEIAGDLHSGLRGVDIRLVYGNASDSLLVSFRH